MGRWGGREGASNVALSIQHCLKGSGRAGLADILDFRGLRGVGDLHSVVHMRLRNVKMIRVGTHRDGGSGCLTVNKLGARRRGGLN